MDKIKLRELVPTPNEIKLGETSVRLNFKAMHETAEKFVEIIFEIDATNDNAFIFDNGALKKTVAFKKKVPSGSLGDLEHKVLIRVIQEPSTDLEILGIQLKRVNVGARDSVVKSSLSIIK